MLCTWKWTLLGTIEIWIRTPYFLARCWDGEGVFVIFSALNGPVPTYVCVLSFSTRGYAWSQGCFNNLDLASIYIHDIQAMQQFQERGTDGWFDNRLYTSSALGISHFQNWHGPNQWLLKNVCHRCLRIPKCIWSNGRFPKWDGLESTAPQPICSFGLLEDEFDKCACSKLMAKNHWLVTRSALRSPIFDIVWHILEPRLGLSWPSWAANPLGWSCN